MQSEWLKADTKLFEWPTKAEDPIIFTTDTELPVLFDEIDFRMK